MNENTPRFLVVDDLASTRRTVCRVLHDLGFHEVDEAADGLQAMSRLLARRYDVVLSDWHMPHLSGLELLRQIRATPAIAHTPVLLLMGYVTKDHIREACEAGANGFVMKPFIADTLAQKVGLLIGARVRAAEAAAQAW